MLAGAPYNILDTLERVDDAIDANAEVADAILESALQTFGLQGTGEWTETATASDMDKARSTIRQLYRDWSEEGQSERRFSHELVLAALERTYGSVQDRSTINVLVPGAGLGRIVFDLCLHGYTVEGNEISYHQLLAGNWILNRTDPAKQYALYPFALDFSNVMSRQHQLKQVLIPDVHPATALQELPASSVDPMQRMSMSAADFVALYRNEAHRETYEAVVTIFFLDTAPNVIRYIETIHQCLKDDGIWVNFGPLLWHFGDRAPGDQSSARKDRGGQDKGDKVGIEEPGCVELSFEEVMHLVANMGFDVEEQDIRKDGQGYTQNPSSMLQNIYWPAYWTARRRPKR